MWGPECHKESEWRVWKGSSRGGYLAREPREEDWYPPRGTDCIDIWMAWRGQPCRQLNAGLCWQWQQQRAQGAQAGCRKEQAQPAGRGEWQSRDQRVHTWTTEESGFFFPEATSSVGRLLGERVTFGCAVNHLPLLLQQKRENVSPLCLIPTVTSPREEQQLLASTSKVRPLSPVGWRLGACPSSLTPTLLHPLLPDSPWWSSCTTAVTTSTPTPGDPLGGGEVQWVEPWAPA